MTTLRLFATVRVAAGTGKDTFDLAEGSTVGDLLAEATDRYGKEFADVLPVCRVWLNGESTSTDSPVSPTDEVALLPPVSGG